MKSLRLSLFNIKKNKKEAVGILFLTLITTFMLSIVVINRPKIDAAFDESFEASGSYTDCVMITTDKYRDEFSDILKKEYGIDEVSEGKLINYPLVDSITKEGDAVAYNYMFVTEKTERKMESFKKLDCMPEEKIAELEHPIWLPVSRTSLPSSLRMAQPTRSASGSVPKAMSAPTASARSMTMRMAVG